MGLHTCDRSVCEAHMGQLAGCKSILSHATAMSDCLVSCAILDIPTTTDILQLSTAIERICQPDYVPSNMDIVRAPESTDTIKETELACPHRLFV